MTRCLPLFALGLVLALSNFAHAQMDVFLNFDADWTTNLNTATTDAGVTDFSASERLLIESNVEGELNSIFSDFLLTFSSSSPGGDFTTIDFGANTGGGALGSAPLDRFNLSVNQTANLFANNFDFILDEFSGSTGRTEQISQISSAITGTAAHELGHSVGLHHFHSYGTPAITPANYADTGGAQNAHIIATGSTGLNELGRESNRTLSQWSMLIMESAGGLNPALHGNIGTALASTVLMEEDFLNGGDVGDTVGTAEFLTGIALPISGYEFAANAYSEIDTGSDEDMFALTLDAGTLTAEVVSAQRWSNSFDTILEIFDTDGTTLLASNDNARYSGNVYGSGGSGSNDSFLINVELATAGTYYVRVSSVGSDTGVYNLIVGANLTAIPEPASGVILLCVGAGIAFRRRRTVSIRSC